MIRPPLALLGVTAALAALLAVGSRTPAPGTTTPTAGTETVPVVGTQAICPAVRQAGPLTSRVSAGIAATTGPAAPSAGQVAPSVRVQPLSRGAAAPLPLTRPGRAVAGLGATTADDGLEVTARGSVAAGLEVEQLSRAASGAGRGLADVRCTPASTVSWFAGGSLGVGEQATLVLADPDDTPALVDVRLWSAQGPVDARPGRGILVPAHGRTLVPLDRLAPGRTGLAVQVTASHGRVSAAIRQTRQDGRVPQGLEWVPPSLPPAARVAVAGISQGPGERTVLVTNPGADPATVSLQLSTGDGQFVPAGLDAVQVPPGTTVATELATQAASSPLTVAVVSDGAPVLAVGRAVDARAGTAVRDFAYVGAAVPLSGPALLTEPVTAATSSTLLVAAPQRDAAVVVTAVPVAGPPVRLPAPRTIAVPGGQTVAVPLPATGQQRYAVDVRPAPGSGPVLAARLLREAATDGPLLTVLPLQGASAGVARPAVVADPAVASP